MFYLFKFVVRHYEGRRTVRKSYLYPPESHGFYHAWATHKVGQTGLAQYFFFIYLDHIANAKG